MRLTAHEDGWIYGIFCSESLDPNAAPGDLSSAVAKAGIVRTKDLKNWERLPNLISKSQQRNVVLHPEFVNGKYALYTRPQDSFIDAGNGGGIGWALIDDMTHAEVKEEISCECQEIHEDLLKIVNETMPDETELYDLAELFKVFGDSTRIQILFVLFEAEVCVCDLAEALHMTQSAISHQLRILKQNKLVKSRREGKSVFYSLADGHVRTIIAQGQEHIEED